MGKNFSTIQSVVKKHESLTLKQMFDVTAQIVNNQEEINCLDKILYGKNSWTRLSLIDDEIVINLQRTKESVYFQILCCVSAKFFNILNPTKFGRKGLNGVTSRSEATEIMMLSTESRLNSSGTFSQGFTTLQFCDKIGDLLISMGQTPEIFHRKNSTYVNVQ